MRKRFTDPLDVAEQFREIAGTSLTAALKVSAEPGKTPKERVHQARRNIKRLRALLHLVRPGFADYRLENSAARDAAKGISPLRDADVLKDTLSELLETAELPAEDVAKLRAALDARTPDLAAHDKVLVAFAHAALPILDRVHAWQLDSGRGDLLTKGAAMTYRRARKAMREAEKLGGADHFHEWRKQVKHQLYQLKLLAEVSAADSGRIDRLRQLATLLGRHHDRTVFLDFLITQPDRRRYAALAETATREQAEIEEKSLALGRRLFRRRPRKWAGRLTERRELAESSAA